MRNSRESCARSALMGAVMIAATLGAGRHAAAQTPAPAAPVQTAPLRRVEFDEAIKQALAKNLRAQLSGWSSDVFLIQDWYREG